jgi:xanthine dehydrogenase accessory factor
VSGADGLTPEQRDWERESEVHGPNFAALGSEAPRVVCFGAVPLSAAVCAQARTLGWRSYVVDPRARFTAADRFPAADEVLTAWPAEAFVRIGGPDARTAVLVLAHAPELDDPALHLALRSDAFYIGALGSRRTQGRRRERLTAAGFGEDDLARLRGPAGLDLGGETVQEAALAVLAEAVAALHGRAGGPLTASENAIHTAGRPAG